MYVYKANLLLLLLFTIVTTENCLQYSIDITTEQTFRYIECTDAKIWIVKNVSLCWVFVDSNDYYKQITASYFHS